MNLTPGTGGAFEVKVNGNLIFSKLKEKRYPEIMELAETIKGYLD
jgi:selT/selW/selH-like putative selenoprotein